MLSFLGRTLGEMGYDFDAEVHPDFCDVTGHYLARNGLLLLAGAEKSSARSHWRSGRRFIRFCLLDGARG